MTRSSTFTKIRDWLFPAALAVAWIVTTGYTFSQLAKLPFHHQTSARSAHEA